MTVAEAIIGVLGAGILGLLGFFLSSIKSDIRALGTRLDRHEELLGDIRERLARIEATQEAHGHLLADHGRLLADHGRLLAQVMGHGERIAALEGAADAG
ncbi:MAG: hypothetical protein F4X38_03425 [Acidimicrobiaceae bacterium]|nr:hypothetical protein [Acidimicrobiaceae bacterium]